MCGFRLFRFLGDEIGRAGRLEVGAHECCLSSCLRPEGEFLPAVRIAARSGRWRVLVQNPHAGVADRRPAYTSSRPLASMALATASSVASSGSNISLCALPDGIIGKQLARFATRQSKITGFFTADHLLDRIVEIAGLFAADAVPAIGFRELDEIRQRLGVGVRQPVAMQKLLPLAHHAHVLVVEDEYLDRRPVLNRRLISCIVISTDASPAMSMTSDSG